MPPTKKNIGLRELRVGLLVVGAIAILIFLILNASGDINPFSAKTHLRARFSNADGLRPGAEVHLAGVRIGKVDDVKLLPPSDNPNEKVEVALAVDSRIDGRPANERIRTDSTAQLGSPGLLGNEKLIDITPGSAVGQPISENALLRSSSANSFSDLASSGNDLVQRLNKIGDQVNDITRKINEGQGSLGRFVNDEAFYNNLNGAIRDTQDVVRQIRSGQGSAGRFVNDPALYNNVNDIAAQLQAISRDLRNGRGTAGKLLTDEELYNYIRSVAQRADQSINRINLILNDVQAGRGTVGKLLTDEAVYNDARAAISRFNTTAERIDNVVAGAQRGQGTVGKLLTDEQLYSNVNQLSSEGVKLIYDFRQNPKKYLTVKFQLF
jgi:phospholipid/cholesterol/gamma-HCH transport system substrate-binding protein